MSETRRLTVAQATMVHVETDPLVPAPSSDSWWAVPVSEVAAIDSTRQARKSYKANKANQRLFL